MKKLDLRKELKRLYHAYSKTVAQVNVPNMQFIKIDGKDDPNQSSFKTKRIYC